MMERFITAFCWTLGPIGNVGILWVWSQKEPVKTSVLFSVFLMDLWLIVRYF
jgi:hypothetical protein